MLHRVKHSLRQSAKRHYRRTKTAKVIALLIETYSVFVCGESLQEVLSKQIWSKTE